MAKIEKLPEKQQDAIASPLMALHAESEKLLLIIQMHLCFIIKFIKVKPKRNISFLQHSYFVGLRH